MTGVIPVFRQHEAEVTAEELIRYVHRRLGAAGFALSASKVTKSVRRLVREHPGGDVQCAVDRWLAGEWHLTIDPALTISSITYPDPTGDTAARNVDSSGAPFFPGGAPAKRQAA